MGLGIIEKAETRLTDWPLRFSGESYSPMPWKSPYGEPEEAISQQGRVFARHSCRVKARYRPLHVTELHHQPDVYQTGWLRSQSKAGVRMETSQHIPEGTKVELAFSSPDGKGTFRAEAVVIWVAKEGQQLFHVGLKFEKLYEG